MPTGSINPQVDRIYKQKAAELVAQMDREEKVLQLVHGASAVTRLGIPEYNWWNEALHGVARAGVATVYPQAIGLAATFDPDLIEEVAATISVEGRAKYEAASSRGDRDIYKGLTFWSPNINIFRDPRWGRGHETYGEDPYLTAELGKAFIRGIQGQDERYLRAAACAKHYAVHSGPESLRHEFNAEVSAKDLWETYLYAFEECVVEAGVESVMGAYNRTNGQACCAHSYLLQDVLRDQWQFDGHVVSDCWAIKDINEHHKITATITESAALALKNGCDLNCGRAYSNLLGALDEGLIDEKDLDRALIRLLTARFRLGILGDAKDSPFRNIPYSKVDCAEHRSLNLETSRRSLVLLKNDGVLPLSRQKIRTIAVIGPNADNKAALLGNYNGTPNQYFTPLQGIIAEADDDTRVLFAEGCHLFQPSMSGLSKGGDRLAEALACADEADVVVLCLGLDASLEGEEGDTGNPFASGDKPDLKLPGLQEQLLEKVLETGKPVIVVLLAGSALATGLAQEKAAAVIQAWYPGAQGGLAIAQLIFGDYSPSGRLPLTFYRTTEELPDFCDYAMQGRTYRYLSQEPLYPFGYGLSFTSFKYSQPQIEIMADSVGSISEKDQILASITVTVANTGRTGGREIVQLYVRTLPSEPDRPLHQLRGVKSLNLEAGEEKQVKFVLRAKDLYQVDNSGRRYLQPGQYRLFIGGSQPDARSAELTGKDPMSADLYLQK